MVQTMNVLIASKLPRERDRLARLLGSAGHEVQLAESPQAVIECVSGGGPDVALLCHVQQMWLAPIRGCDRRIYTIGALTELAGRKVQEAWDLGVDDVMRRSASPEEVLGRVDAINRMRAWVEHAPAVSREQSFDLQKLAVFRDFGKVVCGEYSGLVGLPMQVERCSSLPALLHAAEVTLTLPAESVEVTLGVGIAEEVAAELGTHLFGEAVPTDVMADAMREFANSAGGAFKRSALQEDQPFSLGLPQDCLLLSPPEGPGWIAAAGGIRVVTWLHTRKDKPRRVSAAHLEEGMVLAQPIRSASGQLLVAAGAVLTQRTVTRLVDMVGASALVEVAHAA